MVDASTVVCGSGVSVGMLAGGMDVVGMDVLGMEVAGMEVAGTGEFVATDAGVDRKLHAARIIAARKVNTLRINNAFSEY
jgi:hypothetical protein